MPKAESHFWILAVLELPVFLLCFVNPLGAHGVLGLCLGLLGF